MANHKKFSGKKVLIMGLGLQGGGVGVVNYICKQGGEVTVTDLRYETELGAALNQLKDCNVKFVLGEHRNEDFENCDILVVNPAIPPTSQYLKIAQDKGKTIITEIDLVLDAAPNVRFCAVTGSNGKTTTAHYIYEILKRKDKRTLLGGNMGGSLLGIIDDVEPDIYIVLELSSFQLNRLSAKRSPTVAVVMNLTVNHLDWHSNMEDYGNSKKRIFQYQQKSDVTVLNADDPIVSKWKSGCPGRVLFFSHCKEVKEGAHLRGENLILRDKTGEKKICRIDEIYLPGMHNIINALAASAATMVEGAAPEMMADAFRSFNGVEHRLEFVAEINNVRYYNDSSATTPESVIAAIKTFKEPKILIMGGRDKGLSFDKMVEEILACNVSAVVIMGPGGKVIGDKLKLKRERGKPRIQIAESFENAIEIAIHLAKPGELVLLSPACTSFDQFRNYQERGNKFKEIVLLAGSKR